jgi:hypothetical protein
MLVPKPGSTALHFVVDLRTCNSRIEADNYALPNVQEVLSSLEGGEVYTSLDMRDAFWSIKPREDLRKYTSFTTSDGSYQYKMLPQGLRVSSAVFCRYINHALGSLRWTDCVCYLDDLLLSSRDFASHTQALAKVLFKWEEYGLTLGAKKCHIATRSTGFLGQIVSSEGMRPSPDKVKAIEAMTLPQSASDMRTALGSLGYHRRHIKNFSSIAAPLRRKMEVASEWRKTDGIVSYTGKEEKAFIRLRDALKQEPVLAHPNFDLPFETHCDSSGSGLGSTILQKHGDEERVIAYASRSLTDTEKAYSTWELEALAIVWRTSLWRMYVAGSKFKIVTDSMAARSILDQSTTKAEGKVLRWKLAMSEFDYEIVHRKGKRHADADGLSRFPIKSMDPYGQGPTIIEPPNILSVSNNIQ